MCSAWMSGFGLKNSFSIGSSSLRIHRSGPRCDSNSVESSNAKFGSSGGSYGGCALRNWSSRSERTPRGIEELLELHRRQLADLLLGVVDAALLADARADLLHDLLDVHGVGADVEIGHKLHTGL